MSQGEKEKAEVSYVGYANLPNQVFRKAVKRGFQFSLMVVGQSGLGKSTLINSLFMTDLYEDCVYSPSPQRMPRTTEIKESTVSVEEGGVRLELTLIDTPGFGDIVDNSQCWRPIVDYIDSKYEKYLNDESRVNRGYTEDYRIHCCLYFIPPNGHGLRQIDIEFMKQLHNKTNIVPVIAKADTFTPEEVVRFKKVVLQDIADNGIKIYQFPDAQLDEEDDAANQKLREAIPFAVVGSNTILEVNQKKVRGRQYPWGVAEVENADHCDFTTLRNMIIRTHMQDLKDITNNVHYENYRCTKLANVSSVTGSATDKIAPSRDPLAQFEVEKKEHEKKMRRMEEEMEDVFEVKVREKLQKLEDIKHDLNRRKEAMTRTIEQLERDLNESKRQFDEDKRQYDIEQQKYMEQVESQMRQQAPAKGKKDDKSAKKKK
ncbi:PREDICTED: septin-7-like isoform X2 [Amphimedon queenslandica]|uniref:Septin n=1 Tax=Amphimedon queenslandica TaxID=400682 RepID=A0AAN0IXQ6_AMPQE|nr:PREDICTED: septin-7-like isoform X2 [Amphimedon queenslandica]|eukprot:XP_019849327.1 PREDICTED: septin-7-like isoform X2 [Amphimedon queenslandica]